MSYMPLDEMIYCVVKTSMQPVPAIFKMAINTALILIRRDAEREDELQEASERNENDLQ